MVTIEQITSALETDHNTGFCAKCGEEHYGLEPDARNQKCESCGEYEVCGAEELLIAGKYDDSEETPEPVIVSPKMPRAMSIRQILGSGKYRKELVKELYQSTGLMIVDGIAVIYCDMPKPQANSESATVARHDKQCRKMLASKTTCLMEFGRLAIEMLGEPKEPVIVLYFVPVGAANEVCKTTAKYVSTANHHAGVKTWKYAPAADGNPPAIIGHNKAGNPVAIIACIDFDN